MHYSRYRLMTSMTTRLCAHMRQPVSNGLAMLAHWTFHQNQTVSF